MSEAIPEPVVEIRARFTPSEPLRDALIDLLDPRLNDGDKARLKASFLFQSYRRRLKSETDYNVNEHGRDGEVKRATRRLEKVAGSKYKIKLERPEVEQLEDYSYSRIVFAAKPIPENQPSILLLNDILSEISSLEVETIKETLGKHFFVEIAKDALASNVKQKVAQLNWLTNDPQRSHGLYIEPRTLLARNTALQKNPLPPTAA